MIIGPSGSGKSTLLRTINLLEEPTQGRVLFDGEEITDIRADVNRARTEIGMVFQSFNLFPHMTAKENITISLRKVLGKSDKEADEIAVQELEHMGLPGEGGRLPVPVVGRPAAARRRSPGRSRCVPS